jgi:hypothetical protein
LAGLIVAGNFRADGGAGQRCHSRPARIGIKQFGDRESTKRTKRRAAVISSCGVQAAPASSATTAVMVKYLRIRILLPRLGIAYRMPSRA